MNAMRQAKKAAKVIGECMLEETAWFEYVQSTAKTEAMDEA